MAHVKQNLGQVTAKPRSGDEPFHHSGRSLEFTLTDFWRWSVSDLLNNLSRGHLAEFIVASQFDSLLYSANSRVFVGWNTVFRQERDGGAEGVRTPDLLNAIQALYQLSYDPIRSEGKCRTSPGIVKTHFAL